MIIGIVKAVFGALTGSGALDRVAQELLAAHRARVDAPTETARIEAEIQIEQLRARQAVLVSEQGHWATRLIRPLLAWPFIIWLWKVVVWDMVFGLGVTPDLAGTPHMIAVAVVGAYFLTRPVEKIGKTYAAGRAMGAERPAAPPERPQKRREPILGGSTR